MMIGIAEKDYNLDCSPKVVAFCCVTTSETEGIKEWGLKLQSNHDHIDNYDRTSYVSQMIIPDFGKYLVTLWTTENQRPVISYFKFERETVYKYGEVNEAVKKIAINPFSHHTFIAIGKNYAKSYMASEGNKKTV